MTPMATLARCSRDTLAAATSSRGGLGRAQPRAKSRVTALIRMWWSLVELTSVRPGLATVVVTDLPDILKPCRI